MDKGLKMRKPIFAVVHDLQDVVCLTCVSYVGIVGVAPT